MKGLFTLTISKKIALGFSILTIMLIISSLSGFVATNRLSSSLEYVTGPAWNTADGAMEGVINIKEQIIATHELISNARAGVLVNVNARLKEGKEGADEALGRMFAANQVDEKLMAETRAVIKAFNVNRDAVINAANGYVQAYKEMQNNGKKFVAFMGYVEEVGDAAVEDLENNPDKPISWNTGLSSKWQAADGAMEGRIALLERLFYYQELADHVIERDTGEKKLKETLQDLNDNISQLSALRAFSRPVPAGEFKGQLYKNVLQKLSREHETLIGTLLVKYDEFSAKTHTFEKQSEVLLSKIDELEEAADGAVEGEISNIQSVVSSSYTMIFASMIIGIVLAIFAVLFAYRFISKPLKEVACNMHEISTGSGDLSVRLEAKSKDEIGEIARGFNSFVEKIQLTIVRVAETSTRLGAAVESVSSMSSRSSENFSKQQLETQQVATAINEMAATVSEVATSAASAASSANDAQSATSEGQEIVNSAVAAINKLASDVENAEGVIQTVEKESIEIGSVLDVIRGIAEQTNLLALNAAIEAARAGEQGRGFAVVADEVRTLASRTQQSTEEIQSMIERLQSSSQSAVNVMGEGREQAGVGVTQINEAGQSLSRITSAVNMISDMNTHIASAAEEQSSVAEEVNRNVVNINQLTDENVSTFEEIVRAGNDMETLSSELNQLVAQFKT